MSHNLISYENVIMAADWGYHERDYTQIYAMETSFYWELQQGIDFNNIDHRIIVVDYHIYEGFYNFSKVCCPTNFGLNIST